MRSSWIIWVGPKSDDWCPYKIRAEGHMRPRAGGEGRVRLDTENGVTTSQGMLGTQEARRGEEGFARKSIGGTAALLTARFQTFGPRSQERINFDCCKPPGLWQFVTAATGNSDTETPAPPTSPVCPDAYALGDAAGLGSGSSKSPVDSAHSAGAQP